ncbi:MAG: hypothetical protein IH987_04135, partial [Planctomycetes bacterium]|nr:hypothetical protein [Planctomycetota bacterium]
MDNSKSIALVYNATNKQDYEKVKAFVNYFKEKHKQVLSLGYIDSTDPAMLLKTQLEYRFFTKKAMGKYSLAGIPRLRTQTRSTII